MSTDHIYWTFSAAAQSISAFVAFVLAGYALVHPLMEAARDRDDSLEEIHQSLRAAYHRRLAVTAWLTGAAVVLSLVIVYVNRSCAPVPSWALAPVAALDLAAIVGGAAFVVSIVDPKKYERAATRELAGGRAGMDEAVPAERFFAAFVDLEKGIRSYLRRYDLYVPSRGAPRMSYSFRQMVEALREAERIDHEFLAELLEINKYRNLVFHGHVAKATSEMLKRIEIASSRIARLD